MNHKQYSRRALLSMHGLIFLFVIVFFDPTDTRKAVKPLHFGHHLTYASPNIAELQAMAKFLNPNLNKCVSDELTDIIKISTNISKYIHNFIITLGSKGVLTVNKHGSVINAKYYPANIIDNVINVSGAGDCFAGGYIHGVLSGLKESHCVAIGFQTSKAALLSKRTVPETLEIDYNIDQVDYIKLIGN